VPLTRDRAAAGKFRCRQGPNGAGLSPGLFWPGEAGPADCFELAHLIAHEFEVEGPLDPDELP